MTIDATYKKGLLITFIGALTLTFDTPLLRLTEAPQWTVLFWRMGLMSLTVLALWTVLRCIGTSVPPLINGPSGLIVALLYSAGNISFIIAVYNTTIANVVFILALTPLIAALLSFLWFNEHLSGATWAALVIALSGVAIIVWEGLGAASAIGDLMAAVTATALALVFTVIRRSGQNMSMSPFAAGAVTATIAYFLSADLSLDQAYWGWIALNGIIVMPVSYILLALGPNYISSAEVALFLLLETVLAPIWVWIAVGEEVPPTTFFGGAIILAALIGHSAYRLQARSPYSKPD